MNVAGKLMLAAYVIPSFSMAQTVDVSLAFFNGPECQFAWKSNEPDATGHKLYIDAGADGYERVIDIPHALETSYPCAAVKANAGKYCFAVSTMIEDAESDKSKALCMTLRKLPVPPSRLRFR